MDKIVLTGSNLTIDILNKVAKENAVIEIDSNTRKKLVEGRQLVFDLVDTDFPIYGFNVGVGWNKDKKVLKEFFDKYNANLIRSHSIGVPPYASEIETRAILLARLNTMLVGCTGVAPEIVDMYMELLNRQIHPLIPERGSVGQGDIGLLSHIGLTIIGEGEVVYKGKIMPSTEAFDKEGLKPLILGPKDGLAIVSSNALSSGEAAVVLKEIEEFFDMADVIYSMSLEGINGNTAPLLDKLHEMKGYKGQRETARKITNHLEGSYIYERDVEKAVHDPLSYRDISQLHGAVRDVLDYTKERLEKQLNTSEDNPCLLLEEKTIVASANFDPLNWVLGIENLSVALAHVSKASCLRIIKISNPEYSRLPRFLSPRVETLGFATVQKTFTVLDAEIRNLCNPVSMDSFSLAGDMEDISTNAPLAVQNLRKILDNLRYIFALELIHASQAMHYRKDKKFGKNTKVVFEKYKEIVPFYAEDRNITNDILKTYAFIKSNEILKYI